MTEAKQTDAERYGICEYCEEPKRNRQQDCCGNIYVCRDIVHKRARDTASRLLAVEAELATCERAVAQFDQWLGEQANWYRQNPQVHRTFLDCAAALMKTLRGVRHVAPPSPPVVEVGNVQKTTALAEYWLEQAATMRIEGARLESCETLEACSDELLRILPPSTPVAPEPKCMCARAAMGSTRCDECQHDLSCSCCCRNRKAVAPEPAQENSSPAVEPQGSVDGCRSDVPPVVENTGGLRAEPAQENQGPSGQKESDNGNRNDRSATAEQREAGDDGLARSEADSVSDDRCPEGSAEVPREGIGHHQARRSATMGRRSDDGRVAELEAKVAELEKERADLHGALGDMEHAERERLAAEPAQEAGGVERVSHEAVLRMADRLALSGYDGSAFELRRYIAQQEALEADIHTSVAKDLEAYNSVCEERDFLRGDRDAERTQKEALRVELEEAELDRVSWHRTAYTLAHHIQSPVIEVTREEALVVADAVMRNRHPDAPAESKQPTEATPVAKVERVVPVTDLAGFTRALSDIDRAAAVAKAEAPSEPADADPGRVYRCKHLRRIDGAIVDGCGWQGPRIERCPICNSNRFHRLAEAPSEPAGWVPGSGYLLPIGTVAELRWDEDGPTWKAVLRDHGWLFEDGSPPITAPGSYRIIEPAPRPPASTGGDRPVMMGELVAALKHGERTGGSIAQVVYAVIEELESGAKS